jgi:alpha/beta superfamily hydrolase
LIINGTEDRVAPPGAVQGLVDKLKTQKGIVIDHDVVSAANHFFEDRIDDLIGVCSNYLDMRLAALAEA